MIIPYKIPILFLIYNREDLSLRVLDAIRKVKPTALYISADGYKPELLNDEASCNKTRNAVVRSIDWECNVKTMFNDRNLGCRNSVEKAINWFFDNVEAGIILEDDCLPNESFFVYCETLLEKYVDNNSIMHIGSVNYTNSIFPKKNSYYFSRYPDIWGWATWKRAWKHYLGNMDYLEYFLYSDLNKYFSRPSEIRYWQNVLKRVNEEEVDSWGYRWIYSVWHAGGISIKPYKNFVKNIGFDSRSTHTKTAPSFIENAQLESLTGDIEHPLNIKIDKNLDQKFFDKVYIKKPAFFSTANLYSIISDFWNRLRFSNEP